MDLVLVAFVVILPALVYSWRLARGKRYADHKRWQLTIFTLLVVAVALFELDLRQSGGIFALTAESQYSGTLFLQSLIYGHTAVAIASALIWVTLVGLSLAKFDSPPAPNSFSGIHRNLGRAGMITMALSGLSAIPLYVVGFVL